MDEAFIRSRITELRLKKGVSEYQMSKIKAGASAPALSGLQPVDKADQHD